MMKMIGAGLFWLLVGVAIIVFLNWLVNGC
jgi:hypothetical protein